MTNAFHVGLFGLLFLAAAALGAEPGRLTVQLDKPGPKISPTLYGNIRPVGTTNLGTALTVDVTVPTTAVIPVGTTFYIVKTNGSQTGTPSTTVNVVDLTNANSKFTGLDFGQGLIEITSQQAFLGSVPITPPPGSPPGT
ncbi:MAG: hypothetical protein ABSE73_25140, partial [Planctomycetota bacterium]